MSGGASSNVFALFERRTGALVVAVLLITAALTVPFLTLAPSESASTEPAGLVFDARDLVDDRFVGSVFVTIMIGEAAGGDLLLAEPLRELLAAQNALRTNPAIRPSLFSYYELDAETEVLGMLSIADLVDAELAPTGGLASATDAQVKAAGGAVIDRLGVDSDLLALSQQARQDANGDWVVPAALLNVLSDDNVLGFGNVSINLGGDTAPEDYHRDILAVLRDADGWTINGVGLDVNLTSAEQGEVAGPYIGFTVLAALLLVGLVFRSYWVLAVVSAAFLLLLIWLKGLSNLIGFKDDLVLSLIVPIAMVSFGVDYAFHSIGRYREERDEGNAHAVAVTAGSTAVFGALFLATLSDSVAFLANVTAGIESVIQFGIGAAIALFSAFLLLGVVAPFVVAAIEEQVPTPKPGRRSTTLRVLASIGVGMLAMASVLMLVFLLPWLGVVLTALSLLVTLVVPLWWHRRRDAMTTSDASPNLTTDGLGKRIGAVIATVARAPWLVLPVAVLITALAAIFAVQVPAKFDVEDFFSADTDFVQGLDMLDEHVGQRNGEPGRIYIEGDLTDPDRLANIAERVDELRTSSTTALARNNDGIRFDLAGIFDIFDAAWESPVFATLVEQQTGVAISDTNGDAIPDTAEQVKAIVSVASQIGVPLDQTRQLLSPDGVAVRVDLTDDGRDATQLVVLVPNSRDQGAVRQARAVLQETADAISSDLDGSFVQVTGSPIVREASLEGVVRSLQVSLPVALLACMLVATVFLRSFRYGLASVIPIIMVVAWLYAFMYLAGYSINLVTATIAAVSIGIGIDFALHYISRYREELDRWGRRSKAVRIAGEGTGLALVASATSSAVGFGILALAPMPLFAAYGLLTAVMILMALVATLMVLPSLLVVITSDASPPPAEEPLALPPLTFDTAIRAEDQRAGNFVEERQLGMRLQAFTSQTSPDHGRESTGAIDVSSTEWRVLQATIDTPDISLREVGIDHGLAPIAVSRAVLDLREKGLIDAQASSLVPTALGREVAGEIAARAERIYGQAFADLSPSELSLLDDLMQQVNRRLPDIEKS